MSNKFPLRGVKFIAGFAAAIMAAFVLVSCIEPSPLYGSWADNKGNSFSFFDDGAFIARITRIGRTPEDVEGNYTVLMNTLTLNCTNFDPRRIVTEWDIRGNILYLNWTTADGESMYLSLYKTSN